ncbi:hypothetical protein D3C77_645170 [compost metagenome]
MGLIDRLQAILQRPAFGLFELEALDRRRCCSLTVCCMCRGLISKLLAVAVHLPKPGQPTTQRKPEQQRQRR